VADVDFGILQKPQRYEQRIVDNCRQGNAVSDSFELRECRTGRDRANGEKWRKMAMDVDEEEDQRRLGGK
jgi:hypothetical protein